MNETQTNAMLQSLLAQLSNANANIAARDGEIAVLKERVTELEAAQPTEKEAE